jgi:hypothetical protein
MKKLQLFFSVAIIAIAVAGSAFTTDRAILGKTTTTMYLYLQSSDQPSVFRQASNWQVVSSAPSCPADVDVPCYINYTGTNFASFISSATLSSINAIAGSKKVKQ